MRWPDRGCRETKTVYGSFDHAEQVLDAIQHQLSQEPNGNGLTLRKLTPGWIDLQERRGRGGAKGARSRWRCHVSKAPFADEPLDAVTTADLRRWLDRLEARKLSPRTIRHCAYLVSAVYRYAIERGHVRDNPVRGLRLPTVDPHPRLDAILSGAQIDALIEDEVTDDDAARTIVLALVGTGLRPGELLGLWQTEADVDCDDPHLQVRRSGRRKTKTKTGRPRRVELFGVGLYAVQRWVKVVRPALKIRGYDARMTPWLFPIPNNWLRKRDRVGAVLRAVGAHDLTAHDLRGTNATHLLSGTWGEPWTIAEVAAHLGDSIQTTQNAYAHVSATARRRAARGISVGSIARRQAEVSRRIPVVGHEGLEPSANGLRVHCSTN